MTWHERDTVYSDTTNRNAQRQVPPAVLLVGALLLGSCSFNKTFFPVNRQGPRKPVAGAPDQRLFLTAVDGVEVFHVLLEPPEQPVANVLFLMGSGDNTTSWLPYAEALVSGNFAVMMMDYRGFGQSIGRASHKRVLCDAERALGWLAERPQPVVLYGHSYGGQLAIKLAYDHQDLVAALVTEGAFTSHTDIAAWSVPRWLKPVVRFMARSPWKASELISEIDLPKLIIHSEDDATVPFWMGQELFERARQPKQLWQISGPHCCGIDLLGSLYVQRLRQFLTQARRANEPRTDVRKGSRRFAPQANICRPLGSGGERQIENSAKRPQNKATAQDADAL